MKIRGRFWLIWLVLRYFLVLAVEGAVEGFADAAVVLLGFTADLDAAGLFTA